MKKMHNNLKIAGFLTAAILLAACAPAFQPSVSKGNSIPAGMGAIYLSIAGTDARTVFPDELGNFSYSATFTTQDAVDNAEVTVNLASGSGLAILAPATWTIVIDAQYDDEPIGRSESIVAQDLAADERREILDIFIQPITGGDSGRLLWSIEFPRIGTDLAMLYYDNEDDINEGIDLMTDMSINVNGKIHSGEIILPAGSYLFRAELDNDGIEAGNAEAVHIYSGLDSTLNWSFEFEWYGIIVSSSVVNGSITASAEYAKPGMAVSLDIVPDYGYRLQKGTLNVAGPAGNVPLSGNAFTMPAGNVTITAVFETYAWFIIDDFEAPPAIAYWTDNISSANRTDAIAREGSYSMEINYGASAGGWGGGMGNDKALTLYKWESLTFWARVNRTGDVYRFVFQEAGPPVTEYEVLFTVDVADEWVLIDIPMDSFTPALPYTVTGWSQCIQTYPSAAGGQLWIDYVRLEALQTPPPPPPPPLLLNNFTGTPTPAPGTIQAHGQTTPGNANAMNNAAVNILWWRFSTGSWSEGGRGSNGTPALLWYNNPGAAGGGGFRWFRNTTIPANYTKITFWIRLYGTGFIEPTGMHMEPSNSYRFVIASGADYASYQYFGQQFSIAGTGDWEKVELELSEFKLLQNPNAATEDYAAAGTAFTWTGGVANNLRCYGMSIAPPSSVIDPAFILVDEIWLE